MVRSIVEVQISSNIVAETLYDGAGLTSDTLIGLYECSSPSQLAPFISLIAITCFI